MEELVCIGCGAKIQTEDKDKAGYTPKAALEKGLETGELYCQRCLDYVTTMKSLMCT